MLDAATESNQAEPTVTEPVEPTVRTAPRGRGRPKKSEGIPGTDEEKTPPGAAQGATEGAKKRAKGKAGSAEVEKFAQFLGAAHFMMAGAMKAPEMILTEPEANSLSGALLGLAEQYNYEVNPKMAAIGALLAVSFTIYAPRLAAVGARAAATRAARPKPAPRGQAGLNNAPKPEAKPEPQQAPQAQHVEPQPEGLPIAPAANSQPHLYGAPAADELEGVDTLS